MKIIKKVGIVLLFSVLSCLFSSNVYAVPAKETYWNGNATQPSVMEMINGVAYYRIYNASELAYIAENKGSWLGYNYMLANDLVVNNTRITYDSEGNLTTNPSLLRKWKPIDGFTGIFDGGGYSISGLYVDESGAAGLFTTLSGDVYNLTIENAYIKGTSNVGGIAGYHYKSGGYLKNCSFKGAVKGVASVGGIVGHNGGIYTEGCTNYGDVWGNENYVAGIIGQYGSYGIKGCSNYGNIHSNGDFVGGIAGSITFYNIESSINYGSVSGKDHVGGIIGLVKDAYISKCGNRGTVTGNECVGGICGETLYENSTSWESKITNSYNIGDIYGSNFVAGITGHLDYSEINNSYSIGKIYGSTNVGAIVGYSGTVWGHGRVKDCYYLKTNAINTTLNGFGNIADYDKTIVASATEELFPVCQDKDADPAYEELFFIRKIQYNVNGGEQLKNPEKEVRQGKAIGEMPVPTRKNFNFVGWFTEAQGGSCITSSSKCTGNMVLYAHWAEIKPVSKIGLSKTKVSINEGVSEIVTLPKNTKATIKSKNAKIATVKYSKSSGKITITGKIAGTTMVTVKVGKVTESITVTVKGVPLTGLPSAITVTYGKKKDVTTLKKKNITVKSSNNKVATAKYTKSSGKITVQGKKKGTATITVKYGAEEKKIAVNVEATTTKLKLSKKSVSLAKRGKTATISITATPKMSVTGEKATVTCDNDSVIKTEYNSTKNKIKITALTKGTATLTVKVGKQNQTLKVTVKK